MPKPRGSTAENFWFIKNPGRVNHFVLSLALGLNKKKVLTFHGGGWDGSTEDIIRVEFALIGEGFSHHHALRPVG